jgi:hypothetical protein
MLIGGGVIHTDGGSSTQVADVELSMSDADVPGTGGSGDSAADNAEALTTAV